jgi:DNA-binding response OmpR family regulator
MQLLGERWVMAKEMLCFAFGACYNTMMKRVDGKGALVSEKAQILIVEDDLDLAEMLNAYFRVQGYDVLTANWGADAVRMSNEHLPDLVVLDIRLPDFDGYEVCRQIRANRRTATSPVIFLTEKRDRVDKLQGLELGVVDYITKPFDIQELRLRVRNALSRAQQTSLVNPVTNTPEGELTDDKLRDMLHSGAEWTLLRMKISGLEHFRELYGFVASDDVLRAVSLMMNNAVREVGNEADFIGHLDSFDFVIITTPDKVDGIRERVDMRLQHSMEYFYPLRDRDNLHDIPAEQRLRLIIGIINHTDGDFDSVDMLKQEVLQTESDVII